MEDRLSPEEGAILLRLARQSIEEAVHGKLPSPPPLESLPARLQAPGTTFVTLTIHGELRGCIGALEAYQPLALDVLEHALGAAFQDYRFPPLEANELEGLEIEVSRLTSPQPLGYERPNELLERLRPGIDGVILRDGLRRATFLPQVWEKLPDPSDFLDHLCAKMGASPDLWRYKPLQVSIYQVEEFHEEHKT
jgi:AmmeMemoRadiSam system protein A